MSTGIIHVEDMTIAYQNKPVLWDSDIDIVAGSRTAIVGPNGAGKSTLLKGMLGLIPTISGTVTFNSKPYKKMRKEIAYIPQHSSVNWAFPITVFDAVLMGRYVHLGWLRRPSKQDKIYTQEAIDILELSDLANRQISQLSGGQKQRVFIARALAQKANIYLMDEPLAGVDTKTEAIIFDFLQREQKAGKTSVVVHHDLKTLGTHFDHIVLLNRCVIAQGKTQDIIAAGHLARAFGGLDND